MGGKQLGFADYDQTTAKKCTKKEKFLAEIDQVVPWQLMLDMIEPAYPKIQQQRGPSALSIGNQSEDRIASLRKLPLYVCCING